MSRVWTLSAVALAAVVGSGCAATGARPMPFPQPGGSDGGTTTAPTSPPAPSAPGRPRSSDEFAEGYAVSGTALALRGAPYRNGGADPNGFDCSGFVQYVFGQHGVGVPRETREQFRLGRRIDRDNLAPGDLVFFSTVAPGPSHVGISVGGDQFVHAPSERGVVRVESLGASYWSTRFIGARRVN